MTPRHRPGNGTELRADVTLAASQRTDGLLLQTNSTLSLSLLLSVPSFFFKHEQNFPDDTTQDLRHASFAPKI